jgi:hypothetical protein
MLLIPFLQHFAILPACSPQETIVKFRDRSLPGRGTSVSQDWCSCLTEAKAAFFESCQRDHGSSYYMLGVTLNEAFAKCQSRQIGAAMQSISLAPALCARWTQPLSALLRALSEHARNYGTLPNTVPLQSGNFRCGRAQSSARVNALLSHVLLSQRIQFLRKVSTLLDLAEDLTREVADSVAYMRENSAADDAELWDLLDALGNLHYDLNTCCAEALVLLKSFLVALPESQMALFQKTYRAHLRASSYVSERQRAFRNRRFVYIGGE